MARQSSWQVEGVEDLRKALAELGDGATKAGRAGLRAQATAVRNELRAAAPVGTGPTVRKRRLKSGATAQADYGRLKDNIRVREEKATTDNTLVMMVTTGRAFWGAFQEFGTVNMPARPWFRPVWDRMEGVVQDQLAARLRKAIDAAARRRAKGGR